MPDNEYLIISLAVATLVIAAIVAVFLRARVAQKKGDPERSSFTKAHGEAPRPNRPGTDH